MTAYHRPSTTSASSSATSSISRRSGACRAWSRPPPIWSTRSWTRPAGSRSTSSRRSMPRAIAQRARLENGVVRTPAGFRDAYRKFVAGGWHWPAAAGGVGRPGPALDGRDRGLGDVEQRQPLLLPVPDPDPGGRRAAAPARHRGAARPLSAQARERRVDRHHVPDRAAGRLRRRRAPHPGRAARATTTGSAAPRSSSPTATTTTPRTRSTWCSRAPPTRRAGTRGISLFLIPKFLVDDDGTLGARNDLRCVSLEHKLGIHGSPTCVMSFGDGEGAIG